MKVAYGVQANQVVERTVTALLCGPAAHRQTVGRQKNGF